MRILPIWLSFFMLLQTGFAAACHNVGDVHVICHDDGIETVYVETYDETGRSGRKADSDTLMCCSALVLAEAQAAPASHRVFQTIPDFQKPAPKPLRAHHDVTPPSRGPPVFSAL